VIRSFRDHKTVSFIKGTTYLLQRRGKPQTPDGRFYILSNQTMTATYKLTNMCMPCRLCHRLLCRWVWAANIHRKVLTEDTTGTQQTDQMSVDPAHCKQDISSDRQAVFRN